jgi:hypothetical protein
VFDNVSIGVGLGTTFGIVIGACLEIWAEQCDS